MLMTFIKSSRRSSALRRRNCAWTILVTALICSCAALDDDGEAASRSSGPIVDGHTCPSWIRESIVGVGLDSGQLPLQAQSYCSGTVIAPKVVLTAQHCVARLSVAPTAQDACNAYGNPDNGVRYGPASVQTVHIFNDMSSAPIARASAAVVPSQKTLCNNDLALLVLDRPLPSKVAAPIRALTGAKNATATRVTPKRDTTVIVAGFGLLDDGVENDRGCLHKLVQVLADGSQHVPYLGTHEFVTDYGTCNGDSGGPVFDRSGQLVGVTSRGVSGCRDVGVFPDLAFHKETIRSALALAASD